MTNPTVCISSLSTPVSQMSVARLLCYPEVWQTSVSLNLMFVTSGRQANAKDLEYERSASFAAAADYRKLGLLASGCIFRSWTARQPCLFDSMPKYPAHQCNVNGLHSAVNKQSLDCSLGAVFMWAALQTLLPAETSYIHSKMILLAL